MRDSSHHLGRRPFPGGGVQLAEGIDEVLVLPTRETSEFVARIHRVREPPFCIGSFERLLSVFLNSPVFQCLNERAEARLICLLALRYPF